MTPHTQSLSFQDVIHIVTESRWFIIGAVLVSVWLAVIYVVIAAPVYRVDALLQVDEKGKSIGDLADMSQMLEEQAAVTDKVQTIQSRRVLGQVIDELKLDIVAKPKYFPVIGRAIARWNAADADSGPKWSGFGPYVWGADRIKVVTFDVPGGFFDKPFTLLAESGGIYRLQDPEGNWIGWGKQGQLSEMRLGSGETIRIFVSELQARPGASFSVERKPVLEVIEKIKKVLNVQESAKRPGEAPKFGLLMVSLEGGEPAQTRDVLNSITEVFLQQNLLRKYSEAEKTLKYLEEQVFKVKSQLEDAEVVLNKFRLQQGSVDLTIETQTVLSRSVAIETQLSELKRAREELLQRFTTRHTRVAAINAQIDSLTQERDGLTRRIKALPGIQQEILRLSREVEVNRQLYTLLLNKMQELRVVKAGAEGNMRIIDYAVTPIEPVRPKPGLLIALAILFGLLVGVGRVLLRKSLFGGVDDPDVIERHVSLPVYTVVPNSSKQRKIAKNLLHSELHHAVLAAVAPHDLAVESLRNLRTALNCLGDKTSNNRILITGPAPGVGKSFVSVNLAALMASTGKRVLLIDSDFRRGGIHDYFGIARKDGFSNVLAGETDARQAIRETAIRNLLVVTAGALPTNPSELLLNGRLEEVLAVYSEQFDHVIIDSPPVLAVSDAANIGRFAGTTLLVIKAGQHAVREVEQTIKNLKQAGVVTSGVVFNNMRVSGGAYGYGRYYGYAYAYSQKRK